MDNFGFRFRDWDIYRDALTLRKTIGIILKTFPRDELFALTDQTKRALNSIVLNIAEGANKNTNKDTRVYVNRAHCSLDEVVSCLDCAFDDGYITKEQHDFFLAQAASLARRLRNFTKSLSQNSKK